MTVTAAIGADRNDAQETLIIDYSELSGTFVSAANVHLRQSGTESGLADAVQDVAVRRAANEIHITFDASQFNNEQVTQEMTLWFQGNPVYLTGDKGDVLGHTVKLGDTSETAKFRTIAAGATGISVADAEQNGFDLSNDIDENTLVESLDGSTGVYELSKDQIVTFADSEIGNTVSVYEYETNEDGIVQRGSRVTTLGTSPGKATNLDTGTLTADERYLVQFESEDRYLVLDVDTLDFSANFGENDVPADEPVDVDISSEDTSGSGVVAAFYEEGDLLGDIIHTEAAQLTGDGDALVTVNATADLNGVESYQAAALHKESEVPAYTGILDVVEPPEESVTIVSPRPGDATYHRGDIIPIKVAFNNTDTGTITFGDRANGQNLEINVTVTDANSDGTATVYLNTFQIGAGYVHASQQAASDNPDIEPGDLVPARDDPVTQLIDPATGEDPRSQLPYPDGETTRNHGFFTGDPAYVDAAVAHRESLNVGSGAAGAGVPPAMTYDLVSTAGTEPYKADDQTVDDRSVINLQQRESPSLSLWEAPGSADGLFDAEFISDIEDKKGPGQDDLITPADGAIGNKDIMVMEIQAAGLEGLLHERILINNSAGTGALDTESLFDRTEDHLVTGPWTSATRNQYADNESSLKLGGEEADVSPEQERFHLDLVGPDVIAGTDENGNLDRYYMLLKLNSGNDSITLTPEPLTVDNKIQTWFGLDLFGLVSSQPQMVETPFVEYVLRDDGEPVSNESTGVTFDFKSATANVTHTNDKLEIPTRDEQTITGTTTLAAGTNLTVELASKPGENETFFKPEQTTVQYNPDGKNTWSITTNFSQYESDTAFELTIRREDTAGTITPNDEPIQGILVDGLPCLDLGGNGNCATDTTGNGPLNDVNGDGEFDIFDVQVLFQEYKNDRVQNNTALFNFYDDDSEINIFDIQALFAQL